MSSTLVAHSPKFDAKLTTLEALRALPEPVALGPMHKPVHHARLIDGVLGEIDQRGYAVAKSQYALAAKGDALFAVFDIEPKQTALVPNAQRGLSFGLRSSTNRALAIKGVAGSRVFVCDNLALSGDMVTFHHKSTTGLDLGNLIAGGFDKFIAHAEALEINIARLEATTISDGLAKQWIFDIFNAAIVPVRLFDDVSRFYFSPADDMTDCAPRSLWGLHNAFTRAMKDLSPTRGFQATVALGKAFRMTAAEAAAEAGEVIDAEAVEVQ